MAETTRKPYVKRTPAKSRFGKWIERHPWAAAASAGAFAFIVSTWWGTPSITTIFVVALPLVATFKLTGLPVTAEEQRDAGDKKEP